MMNEYEKKNDPSFTVKYTFLQQNVNLQERTSFTPKDALGDRDENEREHS